MIAVVLLVVFCKIVAAYLGRPRTPGKAELENRKVIHTRPQSRPGLTVTQGIAKIEADAQKQVAKIEADSRDREAQSREVTSPDHNRGQD